MDCFVASLLAMTVSFDDCRLDLHDDLPRRHLLAFGDVDRRNRAGDSRRVHVLHLHRFQRHHGLAGRDLLARLDQHRDDAAVHRRAHLAVAAGCRGGFRRGQRQIADGNRDAAMQEIQPVAVAQEFCRFHHAVAAEADGIAAEFVDLETVLAAIDDLRHSRRRARARSRPHGRHGRDRSAPAAETSPPGCVRCATAAHADW